MPCWLLLSCARLPCAPCRDRAIFNGPLSLLCPDHFIDWATGLWVTASGFAPIDLRFRVASLALCALIFWHEAVGPWVTSFSSQVT